MVRRKFRFAAAVVSGLTLLAVMLRVISLCLHPNFNLMGEAVTLFSALQVSHGRSLYPALTEVPFFATLYPPVYSVWLSALEYLCRGAATEDFVYWARGSNLVLLILGGIFFHRAARLRSKGPVTAWVLFVLVAPRIMEFCATARNDAFALLFELAAFAFAIAIFDRTVRRSHREKQLLNVGLFTLETVSFWARPLGTVVIAGFVADLFLRGERKKAMLWSVLFLAVQGAIFAGLYSYFGKPFIEHTILFNWRDFTRLDVVLFDRSTLSFIACLGFFLFLLIRRFVRYRLGFSYEERLGLLCGFVGILEGAFFFFRAGGDVNYFFMAILFLSVTLIPDLDEIINQKKLSLIQVGLMAQLMVIGAVYVIKADVSHKSSRQLFEESAQLLVSRFPSRGLLLGRFGGALSVRLPDWAFHGPSVSDSDYLWKQSGGDVATLKKVTEEAIASGLISVIVDADENCGERDLRADWDFSKRLQPRVMINPMLCLYENSDVKRMNPAVGAYSTSSGRKA